MTTTTIEYMDIELSVDYDFEPGEPETRDDPGCADEVDINSVLIGDVDITAIIGADHLSRIADRLAATHEEDSAAEHADYLIKQEKENVQ